MDSPTEPSQFNCAYHISAFRGRAYVDVCKLVFRVGWLAFLPWLDARVILADELFTMLVKVGGGGS
jgi:hypothetical protein